MITTAGYGRLVRQSSHQSW